MYWSKLNFNLYLNGLRHLIRARQNYAIIVRSLQWRLFTLRLPSDIIVHLMSLTYNDILCGQPRFSPVSDKPNLSSLATLCPADKDVRVPPVRAPLSP